MADAIEPALDADEWSGADRVVINTASPKMGYYLLVEGWREGRLRISVHGPSEFELEPDECARLIAVLNAAIPDGHPQKITREDAARARLLAHADHAGDCPARPDDYGPGADHPTGNGCQCVVADWSALAAKLTALLPPEGP